MPLRKLVPIIAGVLATIMVALTSTNSVSAAPDTLGTEVILRVKRVAGREGLTPQYMCSAKVQRVDGQVLAQPVIQVLEGVQASVSTTTDSGSKVVLKVVVPGPTRLSYEIDITSAEGAQEHHRATIALPEQTM